PHGEFRVLTCAPERRSSSRTTFSAAPLRRQGRESRLAIPRMLPDHARGKSWLPPRWLYVLLQKTVCVLSDISRPRKRPGPALVVGAASRLADFVAVAPFQIKIAVVAAKAVNRGLDRTVARFDHTGPTHAGDTTIIGDACRHAVLQPADRAACGIARIVEAPRPAAPVPFAHQRAIRRIARGHRGTLIIAAGTIEIGLGTGRSHGRGGRKKSERHQTRPEQAA